MKLVNELCPDHPQPFSRHLAVFIRWMLDSGENFHRKRADVTGAVGRCKVNA